MLLEPCESVCEAQRLDIARRLLRGNRLVVYSQDGGKILDLSESNDHCYIPIALSKSFGPSAAIFYPSHVYQRTVDNMKLAAVKIPEQWLVPIDSVRNTATSSW